MTTRDLPKEAPDFKKSCTWLKMRVWCSIAIFTPDLIIYNNAHSTTEPNMTYASCSPSRSDHWRVYGEVLMLPQRLRARQVPGAGWLDFERFTVLLPSLSFTHRVAAGSINHRVRPVSIFSFFPNSWNSGGIVSLGQQDMSKSGPSALSLYHHHRTSTSTSTAQHQY
jgi:hypothetical protein